MKRAVIRPMAALLSMLLVLTGLAACDRGSEAEDTGVSAPSFTASFTPLPQEISDISRFLLHDGQAYFACTELNGDTYIGVMPPDGGELEKLTLDLEGDARLLDIALDMERNTIWALVGHDGLAFTLNRFDSSGAAQQTIDLGPIFARSDFTPAGYTELTLGLDSDGHVAVGVKDISAYVYLFNPQGEFLFDLYEANRLSAVVTTGEGEIGVYLSSGDGVTKTLMTVDLPGESWSANSLNVEGVRQLYSGGAYSVYANDSACLYGIDAQTGARDLMLNWMEIGLPADAAQVCDLPDGRFAVLTAYTDQTGTASYELAVLAPGEDTRPVLTMKCISLSSTLTDAVAQFNRTNRDYRVELDYDYTAGDDITGAEWADALEKFNLELIAGDLPDIIDLTGLPVEVYYSRGILGTPEPIYRQAPGLDRADYFENILDALSIDGGLPYITSTVAIRTVLADADIVGREPGWTYDNFAEIIGQYGPQAVLRDMSGERFLTEIINANDSFLTWSTGTCNFDTPEFAQLLELAGMVGGSDDGPPTDLWEGGPVAVYDGVSSPYDIALYRRQFAGNLNIIGFPDEQGPCHVVFPMLQVGIFAGGENKDGAWAFVRTLLEQRQQESDFGLPIRRASFQHIMAAAVDGRSTMSAFYEEMDITQEDVTVLEQLMLSAHYGRVGNDPVVDIVAEEAVAYFVGDKPADQVARSIQNRVQTYIDEQN